MGKQTVCTAELYLPACCKAVCNSRVCAAEEEREAEAAAAAAKRDKQKSKKARRKVCIYL